MSTIGFRLAKGSSCCSWFGHGSLSLVNNLRPAAVPVLGRRSVRMKRSREWVQTSDNLILERSWTQNVGIEPCVGSPRQCPGGGHTFVLRELPREADIVGRLSLSRLVVGWRCGLCGRGENACSNFGMPGSPGLHVIVWS